MAESTKDADFEAHEATYHGFLSMVKWSIIGMAVLMVALYFLVQP